ncbi:flagellar basal body P-ring formation chaperone FlgA [Campylobacter sp. CCUG 57310]|uniref:flagellar basal body P-ring formation chaperone FlgA n=1 Tax=Campylobacter sp. CCUG 57310 TaxID=2517362 RepID=UPI0015650A9B|nr:flagellar basal body P-ring formation chaperone FlgA [Campylobacter sp. CCUG 57310]QKF92222.1 flagellar P-ring chaperone FlgA [Campylobacter sp. CCUG 57310]
MYCINDDTITLKTLGFNGRNEEILNLNQQKAAKINSNKMAEILKFHLINFTDKSGGEIIFVKHCDEILKLQRDFLAAVTNEYPRIKFSQIPTISAQSELPKDFSTYKFEKLFINSLNSQKGSFRATFILPDSSVKSIFFRYEFKAKMPILRSSKQISAKHILSVLDYSLDEIDFGDFSKDYFTEIPVSKMISKQNIKAGEILAKRQFQMLSMIKKGDSIQAVFNDGSLNVSIEVRALEDGNLGDVIKVRGRDKKVFYATIISKKQVLIR